MAAPKQEIRKKIRKKKPRNKPILEPAATDSLQDSSLIRALGSPDRDTREKGLHLLTAWLETHEDVSEYDILRLWKGLYFCFWHSDLISVQVRECTLHDAVFPLPVVYDCTSRSSGLYVEMLTIESGDIVADCSGGAPGGAHRQPVSSGGAVLFPGLCADDEAGVGWH